MKRPEIKSDAGRFAYDGLDRVIHEKARLGILTSLAMHDRGLRFNELKTLCSLTDGNLSRHLQALQDAGFIETHKDGAGRTQSTVCRISPTGRRRFAEYLNVLESVVTDALPAARSEGRPAWRPA
jgi:DNA-binding HxlR family transcriptional regulator